MELVQWLFFGPAKLVALWHYAGLAIAAGLIAIQVWLNWRARKPFNTGFFREPTVFAGLLWLIFNGFELQMSAITAKSGGDLLRLDLIVLVPILYAMTIAAGVSIVRQMKSIARRKSRDTV